MGVIYHDPLSKVLCPRVKVLMNVDQVLVNHVYKNLDEVIATTSPCIFKDVIMAKHINKMLN